ARPAPGRLTPGPPSAQNVPAPGCTAPERAHLLAWIREEARRSHAHRRGNLRLAVPRLAWPALPAGPATTRLARVLRRAVRDGREQQHLLPAPGARHIRGLAGEDAGRFRYDRQGEPVPHPRQAAAGPGGTGRQADGRGRRAGWPPGPRAAPASAEPDRRPGAAGGLPGGVRQVSRRWPADAGRRGCASRGGATPSLLVDRGGAAGAPA